MKKNTKKTLIPASAGACLLGALLANNSQASISYFDVNGVTAGYGTTGGGTYNWDDANWSSASGGGNATGSFTPASFAWFHPGNTSYTVDVAADESMAGLYWNSSGGGSPALTINATGSGDLNIATVGGDANNNVDSSDFQGFLCSYNTGAANVIINAPITGLGGIEQQGYGSLYLNGVNTYAGGTEVTGGQNTYYNNNSSFGTGHIVIEYGGQALINNSGLALTIPNGFSFPASMAGGSLILSSGTLGTTFSGNWALPSSGAVTLNTIGLNKISGVISGGGGLVQAGPGSLILSAFNTYTGPTTVNGGILQLGVANAILNSSGLVLNGGTFDPGGFNQALLSISLSATSTIDFGSGPANLVIFSSTPWTGDLNLVNFNPAVDSIRFTSGLSSGNLADIEDNGQWAGTGSIDGNGFISVVPEPSALALGLLGGLGSLGLMWNSRRRKI